MPKFVFAYHGGSVPETPEEGQAIMAKWMIWMEGMGEAIVDGGNPVGMSTTVYADRVEDNGGANPLSGYTLINAANMEEAVVHAKGCPILESGGSVEIAEALEM